MQSSLEISSSVTELSILNKSRGREGREGDNGIDHSSHLVHVWLALTATQLFVAGGEFADEVVAAETREKVQIDIGWGTGIKKWKSKC